MKKLLLNFAKFGISLALIIYLVVDVQKNNPDLFSRLVDGQKNWTLLAAALLLITTSIMLTFVRWYFLVRALDLPFRLRDAFRLGFLGYLLNFVSLGSVGGDLFKAVFIAREQPGRRTAAVTTIVIDRLTGLVGLLVVASLGLLLTDISGFSPEIRTLANVTVVAAILAMGVLIAMMFRLGTDGPVAEFLCRPGFGAEFFQRIFEAARMYGRRRGVLILAVVITLGVHCLNVVAFYCIAVGLPDQAPSLAVHFFIVPLGLVSAALPLPMEGLGAFETVLKYLYQQVSPAHVSDAQGLLVALTYRIIKIMVALIGVAFYVTSRREVDHMIHEAEEIEIEEEEAAGGGLAVSPSAP